MDRIRSKRLQALVIGWIALLGSAFATAVCAQATLGELPPVPEAGADDESIAEPDDSLSTAVNGAVDPELIKSIVREELAAQETQTSARTPEVIPNCPPVVDDRTLSARWDNGFVAETEDKDFRFHIGGRLEFDNSWFAQDGNILIGNSPDQTMRDGTLFRRARFRADGRLYEFIDFACEVNFANIQDASNVDNAPVQIGSVGLTDFYVTFRERPLVGNIRLGHVQAPVSLERYSSSNAWYYMERSSMFDAFYNPNDYQNGVVVFDSYLDDNVTLAGSAAWIGKADVQSFGFGANEGKYGVSGRITALPIYEGEGRRLVHVGAGYFRQAIVEDRFSIASRPLLRAGAGGNDTPNLIFTGTFFSPDNVEIANLEGALVHGPFSLSGEYAVTHVNDVFEQSTPTFTGPRGDVTYQAAYVESGWFVTPGDQRRYDKKTGTWARTIPVASCGVVDTKTCCRGYGAVQLVSRYTYLDLVDGDPVLTPTGGGARAGRQHDATLGVNWYLNSQTWFMINYVATHLDSVVPGADGDIHGVGCRLHLDF